MDLLRYLTSWTTLAIAILAVFVGSYWLIDKEAMWLPITLVAVGGLFTLSSIAYKTYSYMNPGTAMLVNAMADPSDRAM